MGKRILKFLLPVTVFTTPLIPAGFGFGYESIKVLNFLVFSILSGLIFTYLIYKKEIQIRFSSIKILGLLFLIILGFSSVLGIDFFSSLMGRFPYYQGLILYGFLWLFFVMISEVNISYLNLVRLIVLSAFIVSAVSFVQFILINCFNIQVPTYAGRVVSTFGQPNFYSGFLLLALPFCIDLALKSRQSRGFYGMLFLFNIVAICISYSRIGIVLASVVCFLIIVKFLPRITRVLAVFLVSLIVLVVVFVSHSNPSGSIYKELSEPQSTLWLVANSPEKRVLIWPVIFELILERPYWGYGAENLGLAFSSYLNEFDPVNGQLDPAIFTLRDLILDRSHNYFLDLLVFAGVLGLGVYLTLFAVILLRVVRRKTVLWCLIIYFIWINFQNQSIVHLVFFWLIVGIVDKSKTMIDDSSNV